MARGRKHGRKMHCKRKGVSKTSSPVGVPVPTATPIPEEESLDIPCIPNPVLPRLGQDIQPVGPILCERYCDSGRELLKPSEMAAIYKGEVHSSTLGCGTKFRWYFGMMATCPKCGRHYDTPFSEATKKFFVK